ncbi:CopD family protein [Siccirubricoccus sp. KC 17139]|uniref:CopD family protein n=1 Tax=Siccirubricoccus soli TaxID=2899147 RepID=A0ABT1D3H1_9PROT|nr:CopD family protein [Siccirubricoccus soli]MCO6415825.1 CopD family protein [Siccirubricoccus soli]MCP2681957.1 CopD family protein [Siccirubricoccus soli]
MLQGGELGYGAAAVALRAVYYAGSLGGAGLAFFALLFGARLDEGDARRLRHWATGASLLAMVSATGALTAHVGVLMGGETLTDPEGWSVILISPAGASYALGGLGMLLVATLAFGRSWTPMAAAGGVLICASYALLGHTTSLAPRPLLAGLLLVHLAIAAYWIGSLPPLAWASRHEDPTAARLVEDWARVAAVAVPVLVAAGLLLAWWIVGDLGQLVGSWYGWALMAKVALVAVLLGFAAWHRFRLTPALAARAPGAGARLARSVALEAAVALLVLYAAAEMISTSPPGLAHRMH